MSYDLGTAHGKIVLDYNGEKAVNQAESDMSRLSKKSKDVDKLFKVFGKTLGALGKGLKLGAVGAGLGIAAAQAGSLAVQLAGIVPQLLSIGSLSAAIPGMFVGAVAAVGALKASLAGVGDAVKAAFETDPAKFEKALEKLSPAAQSFAKSVRASAPALKEFQQGLQESFFTAGQFGGNVSKVVKTLQGMSGPLKAVASQMGDLGRRAVNFALSADSVSFVTSAVQRLQTSLKSAGAGLIPMLSGLRSVGTVGLPLMDRLGVAVGTIGEKFGAWLTEIASDGRLQSWIETALSTLRTLGGVVTNVGSILTSIFQAAGATGGGLLGALEEITGQFAAFLKSAEGAAAIRSLFSGILDVARGLSPVITTLVGALAGPLGSALSQIATQLGPVLLQVVQALAPAFGPLAAAIADVATAIAPSLPALAQLISMIAQLAGGALSTIAQTMAPVISVLGGAFSAALTQLAPVISQIVSQLPTFAVAGAQLATALAPLVPAVVQVATALTQALLPHLPELMAAFQQLIPPIVQIATIMGSQLASALIAILPYIPQIVDFLVKFQVASFQTAAACLSFVAVLLKAGQAILSLPGKISAGVAAFKAVIIAGFNAAIAAAKQFPFRVGQAIGVLLSILISAARNAWNGLRSAFSAGVSTAVNLARTLPGRVRGAITSLPGLLSGLARSAWNALKAAFSGGVSNATGVAHTLPGRIRNAVGNLGSLLVGAGRDAVMGLVNGIRGAVGEAVSAAASVGRSVISGIKSTLKISSPSRVMIAIGRFVTQGLAKGLLGTASQVQTAGNRLANMVRDAFSDKLIKRGQKNSVLHILAVGNKRLLTLIGQSNTVSARLKTATSALATVQKRYIETQNNAAQKVRESFGLLGGGQNFLDLDTTKDRLRQAVQAAKDFAADIAMLSKRGLNKELIGQLIAAGPQEGGAMADALARSSTQTIREFNSLQGQLNASAARVGKSAADALYGAGLRAAQGLVKGLQSQQKAIENLMNRIAGSMIKSIKKALKIKSPSRIMFNLGKFISSGLALGIESLRKQVEAAAQSLASASVMPTVKMAGATPSAMTSVISQVRNEVARPAQAGTQSFGPYQLVLDGKVVSSFVVDAITGNPKVVSKAANEGSRQNSWAGSGRKMG